MENKYDLIKDQVQCAYELIKLGERSLKILRKQCDHPESEECNYQWGGAGHIVPASMCSICGEILNTAFDHYLVYEKETK